MTVLNLQYCNTSIASKMALVNLLFCLMFVLVEIRKEVACQNTADFSCSNISSQLVDLDLSLQRQQTTIVNAIVNTVTSEMRRIDSKLRRQETDVDVPVSYPIVEDAQAMNISEQIISFFGKLESKLTREIRSANSRLDEKLSEMEKKIQDLATGATGVSKGNNSEERPALPNGDCLDVLKKIDEKKDCPRSGVYPVSIGLDTSKRLDAYCDMVTDGGGWLVIQRRQNGSVNFTRKWAEYKTGFGNLHGDYWIGNEVLHQVTRTKYYKLRVDLEDNGENKPYAEYQNFFVASEADKYRLTFTGFKGTAGDALAYQNGMQFTTTDSDNDRHAQNCATLQNGGWWFKDCHHANLNGNYGDVSNGKGVNWYQWRSSNTLSFKFAEMKIKPMYPS